MPIYNSMNNKIKNDMILLCFSSSYMFWFITELMIVL